MKQFDTKLAVVLAVAISFLWPLVALDPVLTLRQIIGAPIGMWAFLASLFAAQWVTNRQKQNQENEKTTPPVVTLS